MKISFKIIGIMSIFLVGTIQLQGCAIMDEDTCLATDWYQQGFTDGNHGYGSARLQEYVKACSKVVSVDQSAYYSGRQEAAASFCTAENGFEKGRAGWTMTDICDRAPDGSAFMTYYARGNSIRLARKALEKIDSYIENIRTVINWGSRDRGLLANYDYLIAVRPQVEEYVYDAEQAGMNGDFTPRDYFKSVFNGLPDKASADGLENKVKGIDDVNAELSRIKGDSCYNSHNKKCKEKRACLIETERDLDYKLRDYLSSRAKYSLKVNRTRCN